MSAGVLVVHSHVEHIDSVIAHSHNEDTEQVVSERIDDYKLLLNFEKPASLTDQLCPKISIELNKGSLPLLLNEQAFRSNVGVRAKIYSDAMGSNATGARIYTRSYLPSYEGFSLELVGLSDKYERALCGHMRVLEKDLAQLISMSDEISISNINSIHVWFVFEDLLSFSPNDGGRPKLSFYTPKFELSGESLQHFLSSMPE